MIGIIDCNNFYASCERAFDPSLKDVPVVIYSNNDGAIIARSEEAKALGIDMAVPVHRVKQMIKTHNIHDFSSNYALYGDMSKRIKSITRDFFKQVEDYSIDESFVGCDGLDCACLFDYVKDAREKISRWSGVPVSIGVGPSKTLAKLANRLVKKNHREAGVYIIDTDEKRIAALKATPIEAIWGIGRRLANKLRDKGIVTAYDLSLVGTDWAKSNFSVVFQRTVYELQGMSCMPLELATPGKQHIATQKSFGKFQTEFSPIAEALATYTARVAEKLRQQGCVAGGIVVWLGTNNFSKTDKQYFPKIHTVCDIPTDYTPYLVKRATEGLKAIFDNRYIYKRVGIMLTDIRDKSDGTLNLFHEEARQKQADIISQVDRINRLKGRDTVRSSAQGFDDSWHMKQESLSKRYTTRWDDIIEIK